MSWDKIKNFVIGGGLVIAWGMTLGFLDWRAQVHVATALAALDLGTDIKIIDMDTDIADNTRTGSENAEDIQENKDNVAQAFRVLMGDGS